MTSLEIVKNWIERGRRNECSHIIVVKDTYDYDDYPVYVSQNEDLMEKALEYSKNNMQIIEEVYDLSVGIDNQLSKNRAFPENFHEDLRKLKNVDIHQEIGGL